MCVLYQRRRNFFLSAGLLHTSLDRFLKVEWMNWGKKWQKEKSFRAEGKVKRSAQTFWHHDPLCGFIRFQLERSLQLFGADEIAFPLATLAV